MPLCPSCKGQLSGPPVEKTAVPSAIAEYASNAYGPNVYSSPTVTRRLPSSKTILSMRNDARPVHQERVTQCAKREIDRSDYRDFVGVRAIRPDATRVYFPARPKIRSRR